MPKLVPKAATEAQQPEFLPTVNRLAALAMDFKAENVKAYDVRGLTLVTDCFLMCTAKSERQLKALHNGIREGMKEIGVNPTTSEGSFDGQWMLLDFGTVIVHVFRAEAREFYDLDGLWADAEPVQLDLD